MFRKLVRDDKGATAIEYAMVASLIAVAAIGAMTLLGNNVENRFNSIENTLVEAS